MIRIPNFLLSSGFAVDRYCDSGVWCIECNTTVTWWHEDPRLPLVAAVSVWGWGWSWGSQSSVSSPHVRITKHSRTFSQWKYLPVWVALWKDWNLTVRCLQPCALKCCVVNDSNKATTRHSTEWQTYLWCYMLNILRSPVNHNHKEYRGQSLVLKGISYCLTNRFIDTIYISVMEIESSQETLGVNVLSNQCEHVIVPYFYPLE